MNTTIKNEVKNLFLTLTFDEALEATRELRGEYIKEFGVKSWNGLVRYYKKANIKPVAIQVAEPETIYTEESSEVSHEKQTKISNNETEENETQNEIIIATISPENVGEMHNMLEGVFGEEHESTETSDSGDIQVEEADEISSNKVEIKEEEERVEYMLYQNDGEKIDWYGHFVNHKGLKVGESGMMVRMNNLGVGRGKVLAAAYMTMDEIGMFHKCYASIRKGTLSDNKKVELFTKAFNNLQSAMNDSKFATLSTGKEITNFVLNYKKED